MKRSLIILAILLPVLALAQSMGGGQAIRNVARAWLLDPPTANTFVPSQYGMGWSDSKFTLRTPPGNLQFSTTGSPSEPVMTWAGRIVCAALDAPAVTSFVAVPASSESPGEAGQMAYDAAYLYVCTGLNTWKRAALNTW